MVKWPGKIKPGSVSNQIVSHLDWAPTFAAIAGDPGIAEKLKKGDKLGTDTTFKVHLDGFNLVPMLTGEQEKGPRESFIYSTDEGGVSALRFGKWKLVFMEQRAAGTLQVWAEPFVTLRVPKIFNLRLDPFERADITSNTYYDWVLDRAFMFVPAQAYVSEFLKTFQEFPQRQKSASFNLNDVLETLKTAAPQ
jgi:arylsulfatase